jgi:hypothetical protein
MKQPRQEHEGIWVLSHLVSGVYIPLHLAKDSRNPSLATAEGAGIAERERTAQSYSTADEWSSSRRDSRQCSETRRECRTTIGCLCLITNIYIYIYMFNSVLLTDSRSRRRSMFLDRPNILGKSLNDPKLYDSIDWQVSVALPKY